MKQIDRNGFWQIKDNPISKVGIFPYLGKQIDDSLEPNKIYMVLRPEEELFNSEALESFNGVPVPLINEHEMLGEEYTPAEKKGVAGVVTNIKREGDTLTGDISIYSEDMKEKITNGKKELSLGYFCSYDLTPGVFNGQQYDAIQRDIRSNHIALVDRGRCGSDVRVFDKWSFDCAIASDMGFARFVESEHPRKKDGKFAKKSEGEAGNQEIHNFNKERALENNHFLSMRRKSGMGKSQAGDFKKYLTKEQKAAIADYTGKNFRSINIGLAEGGKSLKSKQKETVKGLLSMMEPLGFDLEVTRFTKAYEFDEILSKELLTAVANNDFSNLEEIKKTLEGETLIVPNFYSTTKAQTLEDFEVQPIKIKMKVGADVVCSDVEYFSKYEKEQEVLFPPGTKYKIENINVENGKLALEVVAVSIDFDKEKRINEKKKAFIENSTNGLIKSYKDILKRADFDFTLEKEDFKEEIKTIEKRKEKIKKEIEEEIEKLELESKSTFNQFLKHEKETEIDHLKIELEAYENLNLEFENRFKDKKYNAYECFNWFRCNEVNRLVDRKGLQRAKDSIKKMLDYFEKQPEDSNFKDLILEEGKKALKRLEK